MLKPILPSFLLKFTGVLGAFNCQGGGWCPQARRNKCAAEFSHTITASASPADVEWKNGKDPISLEGVELFAVYMFQAKKLELLKPEDKVDVLLDPFDYELLTVSPVKLLSSKKSIQFAPIGLVNMLNSGGAIQSFEAEEFEAKIEVKGAGEMKAFSSVRPAACLINGEETEFLYEDQVVTLQVPWSGSSSKLCLVDYMY